MSFFDLLFGLPLGDDRDPLVVFDSSLRGKTVAEIRQHFENAHNSLTGKVGVRGIEENRLNRVPFSEVPDDHILLGTALTSGMRRISTFSSPS